MAQSTFDPTRGLMGEYNPTLPSPVKEVPNLKTLNVGKKVCASVYAGGMGSCGFVSPADLAFAELSNNPAAQDFSALGHLPCNTKLIITYRNRSVEATKRDVGAGGKGCGGVPRAIDLSPGLAAALGFVSGLDTVQITPVGESKKFAESAAGKQPGKEPERHCGHISFPEVAGVGGGGVNIFPVAFCEAQEDIGKVFQFITSSAGWFRIGKVALGFILVILAFYLLAQVGTGSNLRPPQLRRFDVGAPGPINYAQ